MATSFSLAQSIVNQCTSLPQVYVQNFLMAASTKDLAMLCTLLDEDKTQGILNCIADKKRLDVISDISRFKRVRIRESQYVTVLSPLLKNLTTGNTPSTHTKYFRPSRPGSIPGNRRK